MFYKISQGGTIKVSRPISNITLAPYTWNSHYFKVRTTSVGLTTLQKSNVISEILPNETDISKGELPKIYQKY